MAVFKKGDRVRRVQGAWGGVRPGDEATVSCVIGPNSIQLECRYSTYRADRFELVSRADSQQPPQVASSTEADPTGKDPHQPGAKLDAGKLRPTLVIRDMARALEAVIKVATDGANKYTPGGWLEVPDAINRYEDADLRHMLKRFKGEATDTDSESLHLAHNAWNALAKLELHLREQEGKSK